MSKLNSIASVVGLVPAVFFLACSTTTGGGGACSEDYAPVRDKPELIQNYWCGAALRRCGAYLSRDPNLKKMVGGSFDECMQIARPLFYGVIETSVGGPEELARIFKEAYGPNGTKIEENPAENCFDATAGVTCETLLRGGMTAPGGVCSKEVLTGQTPPDRWYPYCEVGAVEN